MITSSSTWASAALIFASPLPALHPSAVYSARHDAHRFADHASPFNPYNSIGVDRCDCANMDMRAFTVSSIYKRQLGLACSRLFATCTPRVHQALRYLCKLSKRSASFVLRVKLHHRATPFPSTAPAEFFVVPARSPTHRVRNRPDTSPNYVTLKGIVTQNCKLLPN